MYFAKKYIPKLIKKCNRFLFNLIFFITYDLRPLQGGRVMYYAEDERISIFKHNRIIKFVGYQGEYNIGDSIKIVKVK